MILIVKKSFLDTISLIKNVLETFIKVGKNDEYFCW